jgi:hypothetical protein
MLVCIADWSAMDETELTRIRLVTRRFHELKGLFSALIGCTLVAAAGLAMLTPPRSDAWLLLPVVVGFVAYAGHWLEKLYYPARFGRVLQDDEHKKWRWFMTGGISLLMMVDRKLLGGGVPGFVPLLLAADSMWIVVRDWPFRTHHVVVVAAGVTSSLLYTWAGPATESDWMIASGLLFGIAFIVTGFADHRLLALTLDRPHQESEKSDEQPV